MLWTFESGISRLRGHPEGPESLPKAAERGLFIEGTTSKAAGTDRS